MILRDKLVKHFQENHKWLHIDMERTYHSPEYNNPIPYHAEGNVWSHTMMVMTHIQTKFDVYIDVVEQSDDYDNSILDLENKKKILLISALLHDIGKPNSRIGKYKEERGTYYSFQGHEGLSTYMATDVLKTLKEPFELSDKDIKLILGIISLHGVSVESNAVELKWFREEFREADINGSVRLVEEENTKDYDKRKYIKNNKPEEGKELILMCGIPASGKSTYIKENFDGFYFILSRDKELEHYYRTIPIRDRHINKVSYTEIFKFIHSDEIGRAHV